MNSKDASRITGHAIKPAMRPLRILAIILIVLTCFLNYLIEPGILLDIMSLQFLLLSVSVFAILMVLFLPGLFGDLFSVFAIFSVSLSITNNLLVFIGYAELYPSILEYLYINLAGLIIVLAIGYYKSGNILPLFMIFAIATGILFLGETIPIIGCEYSKSSCICFLRLAYLNNDSHYCQFIDDGGGGGGV